MNDALKWNQKELSAIRQRFMQGILIMASDLAKESRNLAPYKHRNLTGSIRFVPTEMGAEVIAGGQFGQILVNGKAVKIAYAKRQEFEHKTKSGYLRNPFEKMFKNDAWKAKYFGKVAG